MRRLSAATFLILAVAAAPLALAAGNNTKVGIIDAQSVLQRSQAGQEVMQQLKAYGSQLQSQIKAQGEKLQKERDAYERNSKIEGKAERQKAQQTLSEHFQAFQKAQQKANKAFDEKRAAYMIPLRAKLQDLVQKYAQEHGFGMIIDASTVIYNKDGLDITDAILKAFNKAQPHAPKPDMADAAKAVEAGGSGN